MLKDAGLLKEEFADELDPKSPFPFSSRSSFKSYSDKGNNESANEFCTFPIIQLRIAGTKRACDRAEGKFFNDIEVTFSTTLLTSPRGRALTRHSDDL